ncbi:hypothetical protein [Usitatibacter rugosus]|nr:hypothetical protein [Usitatibacter rugosus]
MKLIKLSIAATLALATFAAAGCATTESADTPKGARALPHELEATTGSNMRRRTPLATQGGDVTVINRDQLEKEGGGVSTNVAPSRSGAP